MDAVLQEIELLSERLTSNPWEFNPDYKKGCETLLQRATPLCRKHAWVRTISLMDSGVWWKRGLCNGFLIILVRVYLLLQDCLSSCTPTFEYSARDFSSLWLELSWYKELVQSCNGQPSEISHLDTICLQDHLCDVDDVPNRTRQSCEIIGDENFIFKRVIRNAVYDTVGQVREVVLGGRTFASKNIAIEQLHEVDIHIEVNHPNVVRFKGWCQNRVPTPFIVMELMDGDLKKWVQEHHPKYDGSRFQKESQFHMDYMVVAIDILHQVAQAMRYAHKCNVAHRDMKADNILVKEELYEGRSVSYFFTAKLADFGYSKQKQNREYTTSKVGTRPHRAPEVMKPEEPNRKYSLQVDVWSFGVLAWQVLTGQSPSEKDGKPQKWPKEGGWIHPYLVGCIQSCWEKEPSKRPSFDLICILMQHLKGWMFRNKGIYHASTFLLACKSHSELAKEYQMYQDKLDKWWMNVLISDLRPPKLLSYFNPEGCDPCKVARLVDGLCKGSRWGQNSFIICKCFPPISSPNGVCLQCMCSLSGSSSSSPSNGHSINAVDWTDDHPVAQEYCSQAALTNVELMAKSFVKKVVDIGGREMSHNIELFLLILKNCIHRQCYGCDCPQNNQSIMVSTPALLNNQSVMVATPAL